MTEHEHTHITITVVTNSDRDWSYRDPRGHDEIEISLPARAVRGMDYNQIVGNLITKAFDRYKLECLIVEDKDKEDD